MNLSIVLNQIKLLVSNQTHFGVVWLQQTRLAWHEPLNSYARHNSITEHLTLSLSTRLKYFTTQEKNIFQIYDV